MSIGDVFARAWDLWRRDVGWLILAGLVVGLIMAVILAIAFGIFMAIFAGAGLTIGADLADDAAGGLSGLGAGMIGLGLIVYAVLMFVIEVVAMTFYGGMYEMVIGAYRGNRRVEFGDLFSGFRKFGAYAVFALVMFGVWFSLGLVNVIPLVGGLVSLVVSIWISVVWLYVLPLIADQGVGFGEAASRSNQMVKSAGWWWTFGMVILLGIAAVIAVVLIVVVAWGVYQGSEVAGVIIGLLLFLVYTVVFPPYMICYVSVLYIASGGDVAPATAQVPGGLTGIPPAPPAPQSYAADSVTAPVAPVTPAGADAWRSAAHPLADGPPAPPLKTGGSGAPAVAEPAAAGGDDAAAAQDAEDGPVTLAAADDADAPTTGVGGADGGPEPPEPPAPPAPSPPSPPGGSV